MAKRRNFLRGIAVGLAGALAGCSQGEDPSATTTSSNTTTPTSTTPTTTPEPTPPEARFVVAKDGSGDYKSLEKARRVAQSGDTIRMKEGSYMMNPKAEGDLANPAKALTLVGAGRDTTAVTLDAGSTQINRSESSYTFWRVTAKTAPNQYFYLSPTASVHAHEARYMIPTVGWPRGTGISSSLHARKTIIDPPTQDGGGPGKLARVPIRLRTLDFDRCKVNTEIYFEKGISATDCQFNERVRQHLASGHITNSRLKKGFASVRSNGKSSLVVSNSELHPGPDGYVFRLPSREDDPVEAYTGGTFIGPTIRDSLIHGKIDDIAFDEEWRSLSMLSGNIFRAGSADIKYFIDGKGADIITRNAFIGGDIRINAGQSEMVGPPSVYNDALGVGNYYSAFDRTDEDTNNDGIVDVPRPIPGKANLTDQYPLSRKTPAQYAPNLKPEPVINFLRSHADTAYQTESIASKLNLSVSDTRTVLQRLAKRGIVDSPEDGDSYWAGSG